MTALPTRDDIAAACRRLNGVGLRTPLLGAPQIDALAGRRVLVKAECLQHTGSFKFRGAWNAVSAIEPQRRRQGVVAFSSGNHAQAVAYAARLHGIAAVIVMPADAPAAKIDATRGFGAELVLYDRDREDRAEIGDRLARERGLTLVPPFDDPQVIAGQATCGVEMAEQAHETGYDTYEALVCCSGGGLAAGVALALEQDAPLARVRPVEPDGFDDFSRSLVAGTRVTNQRRSGSIQDAILSPQPGRLTFAVGQRLFGEGLQVSDAEALRAMALAWRWLRLVLEPGGAAALAAVLFRKESIRAETVIVTASGGNVDPSIFARALNTLA